MIWTILIVIGALTLPGVLAGGSDTVGLLVLPLGMIGLGIWMKTGYKSRKRATAKADVHKGAPKCKHCGEVLDLMNKYNSWDSAYCSRACADAGEQ